MDTEPDSAAAALAATLATAERIARDAGRILLEGWERRPTIEYKTEDRDLVTEFDKRAEAFILGELRAVFPRDGVVGEEGTSVPASADGGIWYVDPLDGTVNFAHGFPLFAVSLGLYRAGQPVLGVVHAPALGWTFTGAPGLGAHRNGAPISPSPVAKLEDALLVTGFPTARPARGANLASFTAFNTVAEGLRRLGSAALDLCFVGCGWLDGTWQRTVHPWDTVGGAAIVLAAGGQVCNLDGSHYDPLSGGVVASNGRIHHDILAVLRS